MRRPESPVPLRLGLPAGFIAGLVTGLLLGWVFHGVVGLFVRLGVALVLLIPLAIVVWFLFLRSRLRSAAGDGEGGVQVYTWRSGRGTRQTSVDPGAPPRRGRDAGDAIDVEFEELKRQVEDEGSPR